MAFWHAHDSAVNFSDRNTVSISKKAFSRPFFLSHRNMGRAAPRPTSPREHAGYVEPIRACRKRTRTPSASPRACAIPRLHAVAGSQDGDDVLRSLPGERLHRQRDVDG